MARSSNAGNNARSNSMNPNNPAFHASTLNRSVQLNPTSALYQGPSVKGTPAGDQPGGSAPAVSSGSTTAGGAKP